MSSYLNNIFNFGRSLPAPFDSLPNKKVAVASKYSGGGTQATLVGSVLKAINAVCACLNGSGEGAVGKIDHRSVAEYKSSNSATEYHIVVYDSTNGNLTGSVYDSNTENIEVYVVNPKARDGAALFMAMFPTLMEDDEFEEYFGKYRDAYDSGFTDMTQAIEYTTSYDDGASTVDLYSYAEFDGIDKNDKYRLMDISARGSNRDGAALRYVAEKLVLRPESVKILILVSDGQPADYGYMGTAAEEDLRGIKQEYQRKGITFVAAAIGSDKQNIERIYGDSFLDITDLNQLPVKLTSVVKRHIRV